MPIEEVAIIGEDASITQENESKQEEEEIELISDIKEVKND